MRKSFAIVCLILALIVAVPAVLAQDSLAYGDTVAGAITSDEFSIEYTFEGTEGDVVVIEMRRTSTDEELRRPAVQLIAPDGDVLGDTSDNFSFGFALLAAQLPESGTYTIIAGRIDGPDGDSVGGFELELI